MVSRKARRWAVSSTAGVVALAVSSVLAVGGASQAEALSVSPTGKLIVTMRGNGHGHGLSQYGAQGAAVAGLTYKQILAFYYPHTTLTTPRTRLIRVLLSGTGETTTVGASAGLVVTGVRGALPTTGIRKYRLIADSGSGLTLQKRGPATGGNWRTAVTKLPNHAQFHHADWSPVRVYRSDGTSIAYYGRIRAARFSGAVQTIDVLGLDRYTAGVVPREMPDSWRRAALKAQAVAVRSYALYKMRHTATGAEYDICDTSWCQVYGGHLAYQADGTVQPYSGDDLAAAHATSHQVLKHDGAPILAEYSASNGGYTVAGYGLPYLPAKADKYDPDVQANGNWTINYKQQVSVTTLAGYFGLKKVTGIVISKRDGNGAWGGRVVSGYVVGATSSGRAKTVTFTGATLQAALRLNLGTTLLTLSSA